MAIPEPRHASMNCCVAASRPERRSDGTGSFQSMSRGLESVFFPPVLNLLLDSLAYLYLQWKPLAEPFFLRSPSPGLCGIYQQPIPASPTESHRVLPAGIIARIQRRSLGPWKDYEILLGIDTIRKCPLDCVRIVYVNIIIHNGDVFEISRSRAPKAGGHLFRMSLVPLIYLNTHVCSKSHASRTENIGNTGYSHFLESFPSDNRKVDGTTLRIFVRSWSFQGSLVDWINS